MKKFILTDETIEMFGVTLHRIKAVRSFGNVKEGDVITIEEMEIFRKLARQAKGSKTKFDALEIFRENNLLED